MPLTLYVDTPRWRDHVRGFVDDATSGGVTIVPVTKGNGYGFGNAVLAAESAALGVPAMAVGTYDEIAEVSDAFTGDILVLSPWRPWHADALHDDRIVHTVSRPADLRLLAEHGQRPRVVVELLTSMRRHGIEVHELSEVAEVLDAVAFEGFALHLPLTGDHAAEARMLGSQTLSAHLDGDHPQRLWLSHVSPGEAAAIASQASAEVRLRVATAMWLGDRSTLRARATVLDAHQVSRGDTFGYRQRRARRDGIILIVAGGTAHGIALQAPTPASTARQRAVALAKGGLESAGRALSPFRVAGKQRWFAEPPHMQCSMLWLPGDVKPPAVGDEVDVDVRLTTTTFDDIVWDS